MNEYNMFLSNKWSLVAVLIALGVLALLCARNDAARISTALAASANSEISAFAATPGNTADMIAVNAESDGRILNLHGEIGSDALREQLIAVATRLPGVTGVVDHMQVVTGGTPVQTTLSLSSAGAITLTGEAPDMDSKMRLLARLRSDYGEAGVIDQLTITSAQSVPWREQWSASLEAAAKQLPRFASAEVRYQGDTLKISGAVDSSLALNEIVAAVARQAPESMRKEFDIDAPRPPNGGVNASSGLTPITPSPEAIANGETASAAGLTRLEIIGGDTLDGGTSSEQALEPTLTRLEYTNKAILLSGQVPTDADRDWLVALAHQRVGENMVTTNITVLNEAVPGWREAVAAVDSGASYYTTLSAGVGRQALIVNGRVTNDAARDAAQADISGQLPDGYSATFNVAVNNQTIEQTSLSAEAIDCQAQLNELLAGQVVLFETSSHGLSDAGKTMLDDVVSVLNTCPQSGITIAGWADPRGRESYNLKLSEQRATTVNDYLIDNGIDSNRLEPIGRGETFEIGDDDDAYMERSRRVEFIVSDQSNQG